MTITSRFLLSLLLVAIVVTTGCTRHGVTMPRPLISQPATNLSGEIELLYATDRRAEEAPDGILGDSVSYGHHRDNALGYGVARLKYSVDDLTVKGKINPMVVERKELGRFPESPYPFTVVNGVMLRDAATVIQLQASREKFQRLVRSRLQRSNTGHVAVFVHGFNNSFDVAASVLGAVTHFSGASFVPVLYSWPASAGGMRGYFIDRESGEFTVFHFKELLRTLSEMPEVKGIQLVAHSRGTDVVTTGLRELLIEARAARLNPRDTFRIKNLVLAAPDLDFGVMQQRLMAEAFGRVAQRITIYTAGTDRALGLSQFLMRGLRFGRVSSSDVGDNERAIFNNVGNVDFIRVERSFGLIGHAYYYQDPAVSSDLIRLLRDGARAGSKARPLTVERDNFFTLGEGYMKSGGVQP